MKKDKIITIRVNEKEKKKLIERSEVAKLSLSEYLIKQGLDKEIVIVDGLSEVVSELRRIGNNINQLTYLANSGRIYTVDLSEVKQEIEDYYYFFERIGLKNLCENLAEKSLTDYVIGVLVGLDSNGRKNRGGTAFEDACEPVIKKICDKYNVTMLSQKQFKKLKEYGFGVSEDIANRKADFILVKDNKVLNIEVDYFFRGGSKPEEIIDSYINRQHDLDKLNMGFVLLTDGLCWDNKSKNQLQKGFRNMNYLMNFYLAKNGMLEEVVQTYFK